ncbi:MAG TPA: hypothetical protein VLU95_07580 [Candidatus Acidoferrum sp.]|nr:hypothetical protein [Candidatus Acidoferrum sp.]
MVIFGKSNLTRSMIPLAIFIFSLLVVGLATMPDANAAPTITLNPTSGPPGTTVHITGSGYTANGEIDTELWNGTSAYTFNADANGNLDTTVTVPPVEPGLYGFTITDAASQGTTQTQFTVTQGSASPTPTTSSSASPSPTSTVPEFPASMVILTLILAVSSAAFLMVRKRKMASI